MDRNARIPEGPERRNDAPTWRSWLIVVTVAVLLSVLTTFGLECLFRHGSGGSGCPSGACGDGCRSRNGAPAPPATGHPGGHGEAAR